MISQNAPLACACCKTGAVAEAPQDSVAMWGEWADRTNSGTQDNNNKKNPHATV